MFADYPYCQNILIFILSSLVILTVRLSFITDYPNIQSSLTSRQSLCSGLQVASGNQDARKRVNCLAFFMI